MFNKNTANNTITKISQLFFPYFIIISTPLMYIMFFYFFEHFYTEFTGKSLSIKILTYSNNLTMLLLIGAQVVIFIICLFAIPKAFRKKADFYSFAHVLIPII